jgi:hypothetical protein
MNAARKGLAMHELAVVAVAEILHQRLANDSYLHSPAGTLNSGIHAADTLAVSLRHAMNDRSSAAILTANVRVWPVVVGEGSTSAADPKLSLANVGFVDRFSGFHLLFPFNVARV